VLFFERPNYAFHRVIWPTSSFFVMSRVRNYRSLPMFHGVIQKITLAQFLVHGVQSKSLNN